MPCSQTCVTGMLGHSSPPLQGRLRTRVPVLCLFHTGITLAGPLGEDSPVRGEGAERSLRVTRAGATPEREDVQEEPGPGRVAGNAGACVLPT